MGWMTSSKLLFTILDIFGKLPKEPVKKISWLDKLVPVPCKYDPGARFPGIILDY